MRTHPAAHEDELLAELGALYADADAAFAGWTCPASTECCRFGVTGREPYVTSIELTALGRAVSATGKRPEALRRSLPMAKATSKATLEATPARRDERRCPMLSDEGRCTVYAARPLGCRTFYCDRATEGSRVRHREVGALVRRVQEIAARHEPRGDQGRALTRAWGTSKAKRP